MLSVQRQGRLDEAAAIGSALVIEHPLYETAWNGLGAIYINLREPEKALPALERAHALNPYSVSTVTNLGNASFLLGDVESARRWWQQTLRLDPDNDYARRGLEALTR
jgi:tetratricopeptide (TPR) repeat protein